MKTRQILLGLGGLLCLSLGTVVSGVGTSITEAFSGTGGDYILMAALSTFALFVAIPVVVSGRESQLEQTETPDPEVPVDIPPVGDEFDQTIRGVTFRTPVIGDRTRQRVKARLRKAAVEALMRTENCGHSRAKRLVRHGEWTDDDEAIAFLGSPEHSVAKTMVKSLPRRQTPAEYRARRTAEAIHAVEEGTNK